MSGNPREPPFPTSSKHKQDANRRRMASSCPDEDQTALPVNLKKLKITLTSTVEEQQSSSSVVPANSPKVVMNPFGLSSSSAGSAASTTTPNTESLFGPRCSCCEHEREFHHKFRRQPQLMKHKARRQILRQPVLHFIQNLHAHHQQNILQHRPFREMNTFNRNSLTGGACIEANNTQSIDAAQASSSTDFRSLLSECESLTLSDLHRKQSFKTLQRNRNPSSSCSSSKPTNWMFDAKSLQSSSTADGCDEDGLTADGGSMAMNNSMNSSISSTSSLSSASSTCSQQARMNAAPCDVTIDELASYFETFVHIPKKMSTMAEMMFS